MYRRGDWNLRILLYPGHIMITAESEKRLQIIVRIIMTICKRNPNIIAKENINLYHVWLDGELECLQDPEYLCSPFSDD